MPIDVLPWSLKWRAIPRTILFSIIIVLTASRIGHTECFTLLCVHRHTDSHVFDMTLTWEQSNIEVTSSMVDETNPPSQHAAGTTLSADELACDAMMETLIDFDGNADSSSPALPVATAEPIITVIEKVTPQHVPASPWWLLPEELTASSSWFELDPTPCQQIAITTQVPAQSVSFMSANPPQTLRPLSGMFGSDSISELEVTSTSPRSQQINLEICRYLAQGPPKPVATELATSIVPDLDLDFDLLAEFSLAASEQTTGPSISLLPSQVVGHSLPLAELTQETLNQPCRGQKRGREEDKVAIVPCKRAKHDNQFKVGDMSRALLVTELTLSFAKGGKYQVSSKLVNGSHYTTKEIEKNEVLRQSKVKDQKIFRPGFPAMLIEDLRSLLEQCRAGTPWIDAVQSIVTLTPEQKKDLKLDRA